MDLFDTLTFAEIQVWTTFLDTLSLTEFQYPVQKPKTTIQNSSQCRNQYPQCEEDHLPHTHLFQGG
jgi:hypothetical protein